MQKKCIWVCLFLLLATFMAAQETVVQRSATFKVLFSLEKKFHINQFLSSPDGRKYATEWFQFSVGPQKSLAVIDGQKYTSDFGKLREQGLMKLIAGAVADDIGGIDAAKTVSGLLFSLDGKSVAFRLFSGKQQMVVCNGAEKKPYKSVRHLTFSPDSQHLAYTVESPEGFRSVLDDQEGPAYEEVSPAVFSPDGKHLAYAAKTKNNNWIIVTDGVESASYEGISRYHSENLGSMPEQYMEGPEIKSELVLVRQGAGLDRLYRLSSRYEVITNILDPRIVFSPDGQRQAFVAKSKKKEFVVLDGKAGKEYGSIESLVFAPDSKRCAYIARLGSQSLVVIDEKEEGPFKSIGSFSFSSDGQHYCYIASSPRGSALIQDGKEGAFYQEIAEFGITLDHQHYALLAKQAKSWLIIADGVETSTIYDKVENFYFIPASQKIVFAGRSEKKWHLVQDGNSGKGYKDIKDIVVSPDGQKAAYRAKTDRQWILVTPENEEKAYEEIEGAIFSPDSSRFACFAKRDNNWFLVLDGKEGKPYSEVQNLIFSPDGEHAVFAARADKSWSAVVDDQEGTEKFDRLVFLSPKIIDFTTSPLVVNIFMFEGPKTFFYYGVRTNSATSMNEYYLVEEGIV